MNPKESVMVNEFVNGILDPNEDMLGPVKDGGHIIANTSPGCWGPMITPSLRGGHEVTKPVYVEGAEVGDAIAIKIKSMRVTSIATASGNDEPVEGRFLGDPFVAVKCPECGTMYPETVIKGTGEEAIRCKNCDTDVTPFRFTNAYTMTFDDTKNIGITVDKDAAETIGKDGKHYMATPENSVQNPVVTFAPHEYSMTKEQLEHRTDGHMDINRAREGAIVMAPVKVPGGGIYLGDMHAMQGDGEIAGHTTDVSGIVTMQVSVIKGGAGKAFEGPILLPVEEDLPYLAKPLTAEERRKAEQLRTDWNMVQPLERSLPLQFVGTGATLNEATTNGLERAANLLEVTVPEVMNRATATGSIEIGRHPGVITITFLVPIENLEKLSLAKLAIEQYGPVI